MRKNLLIKADPEKGVEVINQLLKFDGVKNKCSYTGKESVGGYFINGNNVIDCYEYLIDQGSYYKIMTLEEFQTKFPIKPGDQVIIKEDVGLPSIPIYKIKEGLIWDSEHEEVIYQLDHITCPLITRAPASELILYTPDKEEHSSDSSEFKLFSLSESTGNLEFKIPKGYTFDQIKDNRIILKKKYPNDYIECCKILGCSWEQGITIRGVTEAEKELSKCLIILKRCRDAYWKLSEGWKEMRLEDVTHYVIYSTASGKIVNAKMDGISKFFLDFPTEEMRDMFYQNFKDIIEICKEFL